MTIVVVYGGVEDEVAVEDVLGDYEAGGDEVDGGYYRAVDTVVGAGVDDEVGVDDVAGAGVVGVVVAAGAVDVGGDKGSLDP